MTDDNIIRIHPELKDVENRPQTILETSLKEREFHNPFSSRKEYKKRETAFIQEQANLAARMGTSFEDMEKMTIF